LFGKIPVHSIETTDLFTEEFDDLKGREDVVAIAPDGGALKFVSRFGRALGIKTAVALKERSPDGSVASELVGEMKGKTIAVVLDDMISSGGTIYEVVRKLAEMAIPQIMVGATHNLCMESALARLTELNANYNLKKVVVTDSIAQSGSFLTLPFLRVKTLANIIAKIINRVHYEYPADEIRNAVDH
jgi:ribose-phosphate pyrophosphokinase